jgi:predicted Zn-dependent peptidase
MHKLTQPAPSSVASRKALYKKTVLDNGIRVVTERIPSVRSVSLGLWANVGSRDESAEESGISHFLEHMVFKGTKKRSVLEIAQSLESLGGYLNAFTNKEQTCFYARALDEHVGEAMDVISDLIQNSTFKKKELERERTVVIEELRSAADNPEDIIFDYFDKAIFPEHNLGFPIIGTEVNLRRFTRDDLLAHIETHYAPSHVVVAAAGNVDHNALVRLTEKYLTQLPAERHNGNRLAAPKEIDHSTYAEYYRPINQAHICLGTLGYSIRHRDRYAFMVMNALLGEGMSSRLYQTIREKHGLAYSVYSFANMMSDAGVFGVYIGTEKKNVKNSIELIQRELSKLRTTPVTKAELDRTKSQIKGVMMLGLENMSGRMMRLGSTELYFESFTSLDEIIRRVDAVTSEELQSVANDLFRAETFSTVIVRPA